MNMGDLYKNRQIGGLYEIIDANALDVEDGFKRVVLRRIDQKKKTMLSCPLDIFDFMYEFVKDGNVCNSSPEPPTEEQVRVVMQTAFVCTGCTHWKVMGPHCKMCTDKLSNYWPSEDFMRRLLKENFGKKSREEFFNDLYKNEFTNTSK